MCFFKEHSTQQHSDEHATPPHCPYRTYHTYVCVHCSPVPMPNEELIHHHSLPVIFQLILKPTGRRRPRNAIDAPHVGHVWRSRGGGGGGLRLLFVPLSARVSIEKLSDNSIQLHCLCDVSTQRNRSSVRTPWHVQHISFGMKIVSSQLQCGRGGV